MLTQAQIQSGFNSLEDNITSNTAFINAIPAIIATAVHFDGKVLNKRFTEALNTALGDSINVYSYKESYKKDAIDISLYLKKMYSANISKQFRFEKDTCFTLTDSGKLRINAKGFKERCHSIREGLIEENTRTREDIDRVYQMLAEAQEIQTKVKEFQAKYSYGLMSQFKCNYILRTW